MANRKPQGFAHQMLILLIVLVAVVAVVGYRVYLNHQDKGSVSTTSSTKATAKVSKSDIQQASTQLDSDKGPTQLDPSQLDNDLNQIL